MFPLLARLQVGQKLLIGFGLVLLCMSSTLVVATAASVQQRTITEHLVTHLFPARQAAREIVFLVRAADDDGAWYVMARNPRQASQLLQTYYQEMHQLRSTLVLTNALADTTVQRHAIAMFRAFYFGAGGYYDGNEAVFALKRAGKAQAAFDGYVNVPFVPSLNSAQTYIDVVAGEIAQQTAEEQAATARALALSVALGGSSVLLGLGIALLVARSMTRLYTEITQKSTALSGANAQLQLLATTDALTGQLNHRAMGNLLDQELERADRFGRACSILFLDLDHFKSLNDAYGHAAGDTTLHDFAALVRTHLRGMDTIGRWGGEEFVILLPETDGPEALEVAERVRSVVAASPFAAGGGMHLSCSVGVATYPTDAPGRNELLVQVDRAMYAAKGLGRNQVRTVNDPAVAALEKEAGEAGDRDEQALMGTVEALASLVETRHQGGEDLSEGMPLTISLALALGFDAVEARMIGVAARLHDVGKTVVPDAVLQKSTRLTEDEWVLMRRHPAVGAEVVRRVPALRGLATMIHSHHERWDGTGYPDQIAGEDIPLGARMVAVVDAYMVMTHNRAHQKAHTEAWARDELRRCAGTQFDPQVVEAFLCLLDEQAEKRPGADDEAPRMAVALN